MLNHIVLMGRLTRDPELRATPSGTPVATFTLAVDRDFKGQDGQRETDFIDFVAWRSTRCSMRTWSKQSTGGNAGQ